MHEFLIIFLLFLVIAQHDSLQNMVERESAHRHSILVLIHNQKILLSGNKRYIRDPKLRYEHDYTYGFHQ